MTSRLVTLALLLSLPASAGKRPDHHRHWLKNVRYSRASAGGGSTPTVQPVTPPSADIVFQESFIATAGRECEGTIPTPTVGGALTYTRATAASCVKGDGSLVTLASGQPRITAALGYLSEAGATNNIIRSEEIDNPAYTDSAVVAAAPVLNGANAGVSPEGTTTAEDYTFDATTAVQLSQRARAGGCSAGTQRSASVWIKGVSGSGTTDLCVETTTGAAWTCTSCAFTNAAWSRCMKQGANVTSGGGVYIGNGSLHNGGTTRASNRIYVWGAQCEVGLLTTSYVATAGTTVARNADLMTTSTPNVVGTLGCASLDYTPLATGITAGLASWSDTSRLLYTNSGATQMRTYNGAVEPNVASASTAGVSRLYRSTWSTAANQLIMASPSEALSSTSTHTSWVGGTATLSIGYSLGAGTQSKGSLRNFVIGKTTTACP